jgi:hypothetical protein
MLVRVSYLTIVTTRVGSARILRLITINLRKCTSVNAKVHFFKLIYSSASLKN